MAEKKNQKIVILSSYIEEEQNLIQHGFQLAQNFKKDLLIIQHQNRKTKKNNPVVENALNKIVEHGKRNYPTLNISTCTIEIKNDELPEVLADDYEAILVVASGLKYKYYASAVTNSPIPFLFVHPALTEVSYTNIVFPLDLRKENADSTLWSSWFGRFCNSKIAVVVANDKDSDSKKQVHHNLLFAKKLFNQANIVYKLFKGKRSSLFNSYEASEYAITSNANLLILLGSSTITPLDWLIGLPERKIIRNAGKMAVLLVNPRRDNYVLCD